MLSHSHAAVLLTEPSLEKSINYSDDIKTIVLEQLPEDKTLTPLIKVSSESPAYILYTSGSTGKPKGVMIPRRALTKFLVVNV
jgi:long-subunit acyl-CoA synthetase (AMP-forming)